MNRSQLEHVLRAAAEITKHRDFIIIGSQSILGAFPKAPTKLLQSMELDLYPRDCPTDAIQLDGAIGYRSMFHQTFGYYADGVGPETSTLPSGWDIRLIRVESPNTGGAVGWCLDPADLAVAKLVAGREKDNEYVRLLIRHRLVQRETIIERMTVTDLPIEHRQQIEQRLGR